MMKNNHLKVAFINGKRYEDVVTHEEYCENPKAHAPGRTIVQHDGVLYPVRYKNDTQPGYYPGEVICRIVRPEPELLDKYSEKNALVDFTNVKDIREHIAEHTKFTNAENAILSNVETVYEAPISGNESPEMRALKDAVNAKHMDLSKYEGRFGETFNNDKRLFKKDDITLSKLRSIANNLDIKVTLILEDAGQNIANPMGNAIVTEITSPDNDYGGEE